MKWTLTNVLCKWSPGWSTANLRYCYCSTVHSLLNWFESMLIIKMKITVMIVCKYSCVCVNTMNMQFTYLSPNGFVFFFLCSLIDRYTEYKSLRFERSKPKHICTDNVIILLIQSSKHNGRTNLVKSKGTHNLKCHTWYTHTYQCDWWW